MTKMMKKSLLLIAMSVSLFVQAQKQKVESAAIYLRNSEIEEAVKAIDEAAIDETTMNDPKMWFYRAAIYDTIYRNPEYKPFAKNIEENLVVACLKCISTDEKKKYDYYCGYAVINGAFAAYNKAIEFYQKEDAVNATKFFQYVIDVMPYDKNKDLIKNNINEKSITLTMADLAMRTKQFSEAKKQFQKLIDMDYNDPIIYLLMANIFYTEGDTIGGLKITELGRKRFTTDKELINQELNIYLAQGKQQILLDKLNEALDIDSENPTLLFVRGNIYDSYSKTAAADIKKMTELASATSKKAKKEQNPSNKAKLNGELSKLNKQSDSTKSVMNTYITNAEKDYTKAAEINQDYLDAWYNLGALTNNKTTEWADKMNALSAPNQADYDKKWKAMKKIQDSILNVALGHFDKALQIAENLPEDTKENKKAKMQTLISLYYTKQQVYANLNDEKMTLEMMNKRRAIEDQQ
jgi:Tfp pilus assembly protein PilF